MLDFPSNPTLNDVFDRWRWDGTKWVLTATGGLSEAPQDGTMYARRDGEWVSLNIPEIPEDVSILPVGGRLILNGASSATTVRFLPYNGDWVRIAGEYFPIPPNGIVSPAATTLTQNVVHFVYLFDNSGLLAIEFSTTGHVTSSTAKNVGTEIKNGDDTRTLIGMVWPISNQFRDTPQECRVISWLNRKMRSFFNAFSVPTTGWVSAALVPTCTVTALAWGDESVQMVMSGYATAQGAGQIGVRLIMDGTATGGGSGDTVGAGTGGSAVTSLSGNLSEGSHSFQAGLSSTVGLAAGAQTVITGTIG